MNSLAWKKNFLTNKFICQTVFSASEQVMIPKPIFTQQWAAIENIN